MLVGAIPIAAAQNSTNTTLPNWIKKCKMVVGRFRRRQGFGTRHPVSHTKGNDESKSTSNSK